MNAPIAMFVYNRPDHTRRTIEALQKNAEASDTELFIFSDAPKDEGSNIAVKKVREYIRTINGFKKVDIIEREENWGLARSIISGVTEIVNKYGRLIVLEDDLVTSPYFLTYMNEGLNLYEDESIVASIHGYIYPVKQTLPETFFLRGADCWGWATWKRAWAHFESNGEKLMKQLEERGLTRKFDLDGAYGFSALLRRQIEWKSNSWAIRFHASAFLAGMLTLYPGRSLVENIGNDKTGIHGTQARFYSTNVSDQKIHVEPLALAENTYARQAIINYFRSIKTPLWIRALRKIKSCVQNH